MHCMCAVLKNWPLWGQYSIVFATRALITPRYIHMVGMNIQLRLSDPYKGSYESQLELIYSYLMYTYGSLARIFYFLPQGGREYTGTRLKKRDGPQRGPYSFILAIILRYTATQFISLYYSWIIFFWIFFYHMYITCIRWEWLPPPRAVCIWSQVAASTKILIVRIFGTRRCLCLHIHTTKSHTRAFFIGTRNNNFFSTNRNCPQTFFVPRKSDCIQKMDSIWGLS